MHNLHPDIQQRWVDDVNGLRMHVLQVGDPTHPCMLLLHGFPELAYSWRKVMVPLAQAGYFVLAPDLRGYGQTTGWDNSYTGNVASFGMLNLVQDCVALLDRVDVKRVACVVGHDFGSPLAAWCGLVRNDLFDSVVLMSAPFGGPPGVHRRGYDPIHDKLAALPEPRKHYQWYYSTATAEADLLGAPEGLHNFLRAYYHMKSADWAANQPQPLGGWRAEELARLPDYYVMPLGQTMPEAVAPALPEKSVSCTWLTDAELDVYVQAYRHSGFQGGLNWYRCSIDPDLAAPLRTFAGARLTLPTLFIAGQADWGIHQTPGSLQRMQERVCTAFAGTHVLPGAGHWVQQEQPEAVVASILDFLSA